MSEHDLALERIELAKALGPSLISACVSNAQESTDMLSRALDDLVRRVQFRLRMEITITAEVEPEVKADVSSGGN